MSTGELDRYVPLVHFLGAFLGPECEVVLHDTCNIESSLRAIANGHISGRQVGAPLTDLALRLVKDRVYETQDFVMGYKTVSRQGTPLHSATCFLRGDDGSLIGMLCLNLDRSKLTEARALLDSVLQGQAPPAAKALPAEEAEIFSASLEDLTSNMIEAVISRAGLPPERMNPEEKQAIVQELNAKGVFLLKGAVAQVARKLAASEPTIYRYVQKAGS